MEKDLSDYTDMQLLDKLRIMQVVNQFHTYDKQIQAVEDEIAARRAIAAK